jgi:DNA-3-methyladenine glycosylase II
MSINSLSKSTFFSALSYLSTIDKDLKFIIDKYGPPPMWSRDPGFPTLIYIVLEQQVSLASAKAAFEKLTRHTSPLTPEKFLTIDDSELKKIGFSRQKTDYCRNIATAIINGTLRINEFLHMPDSTVRLEMLKITGIGPWTADIYLLMALNRQDIWPVGDLALVSAIQKLKNLPEPPDNDQFESLGEPWKPWRAVAARILWHFYLSSQ